MIRFTDMQIPFRLPDSAEIGHEQRKTEYLAKRWRETRGQLSGKQFIQTLPRSLQGYCVWSLDGSPSARPDSYGVGTVLMKSFGAEKGARRGSNKLAATLYGKLLAQSRTGGSGTAPNLEEGSFSFDDGMIRYRLAVVSLCDETGANSGWLGLIDWSANSIKPGTKVKKRKGRDGGFAPVAGWQIRGNRTVSHRISH